MPDEKTFLAVTGDGVSRAGRAESGAWTVDNVLAGRKTTCIAADPIDADSIYVGTHGEGVFRSVDRGLTWHPAGLDGRIVKSLAVSPHRQGLIYAGMKPAGMFMSSDGGASWAELEGFRRIRGRRFWISPAEPPDVRGYVNAIALSPAEPDVVMAGIEYGAVVRSDDGGQSWSNHLKGALRDCHDMTFHARRGDWVYEAGGDGGAALSRESGRSWRKMTEGIAHRYGVACAADPEQPEIWYVSVAPGPGKAYGRKAEAYLYRASADGAWEPIGWQPHPLPQMPIVLVTDTNAPGHLYAGLTYGDVWHSSDLGDSWEKLPFTLGRIRRRMIILGPASRAS